MNNPKPILWGLAPDMTALITFLRSSVRIFVTLGLVAAFIFMADSRADLKDLTILVVGFYFVDRAAERAVERAGKTNGQ